MKAQIDLLMNRVDGLSTRERGLVLASVAAVIYLIWDLLIFNPVAVAKQKVDHELMATQQKTVAMIQEEQALISAVNADPDRDLKHQLKQLNEDMRTLDTSLSELSLGLVPVRKLTTILQDVLRRTGALELEKLETIPVEELKLKVASDSEAENSSAGVYKHGAALTVRGSFFELLEYLQALEDMDWRFYWEELQFEQIEYPDSVITIKVYTLTTDAGLFGV